MFTFDEFLIYFKGLFCGILLIVFVECFIIFKSLKVSKQNNPSRDGPIGAISEGLPTVPHAYADLKGQVVEYILKSLNNEHSNEKFNSKSSNIWKVSKNYFTTFEQCNWLNVCIHRHFIELSGSEFYKYKVKKQLEEKINTKLQGNSFVVLLLIQRIL